MASIKRRPDGTWRARYRASDGRERSKHFKRKLDAERWVSSQVTDRARGVWVNSATEPDTGPVPVLSAAVLAVTAERRSMMDGAARPEAPMTDACLRWGGCVVVTGIPASVR